MLSQQFAARAVELNHEPAKAQPRWLLSDMKGNACLIDTISMVQIQLTFITQN